MNTLIIGAGQIGSALKEIFEKRFLTFIRDVEEVTVPKRTEILHIAYPYSEDFVAITRSYIDKYAPKLTIIHSTVAVGTTKACGPHVLHSPERGRFPNLHKEMLAYKKFIGGGSEEDRALAAAYFSALDWEVSLVEDSKTTEMLKLISNAHMGLEIAWRQELARWGVNPLAYKLWEESYFQGYMSCNDQHLVRPRMSPEPIGGHCILPSVAILKDQFPSLLLDFVETSNELAKREKEARESTRTPEVPAIR